MLYSRTIDRALIIAAHVHATQTRKGSDVPYIIHPFHVALILERSGASEDVVIAGLLHDVLEDVDPNDRRVRAALSKILLLEHVPGASADFTPALEDALCDVFGERVIALVRAVTDPKSDASGEVLPWAVRKRHSLARLEQASAKDPEVAWLKAADVIHNARSIVTDIEAAVADVLKRFNATPRETLWYYSSVAGIVRRVLGDAPLVGELEAAVSDLERLVQGQLA